MNYVKVSDIEGKWGQCGLARPRGEKRAGENAGNTGTDHIFGKLALQGIQDQASRLRKSVGPCLTEALPETHIYTNGR